MWSVTLKTPSNCAIMVGLCCASGKRKLKSTLPTVWQRCSAAFTQEEEQSLYGEHVTDARRRNGAHGERATDARRRSGAVRRTYKTKGVLPNCVDAFALMLCVRIRLAQLALPSASLHQREINL